MRDLRVGGVGHGMGVMREGERAQLSLQQAAKPPTEPSNQLLGRGSSHATRRSLWLMASGSSRTPTWPSSGELPAEG